jgi:replication-associated recombination protein RarA
MLEGGEDPLYIGRRMVRMASEDIGLADSQALPLVSMSYHAVHLIKYADLFWTVGTGDVSVCPAYRHAGMRLHLGTLHSLPRRSSKIN